MKSVTILIRDEDTNTAERELQRLVEGLEVRRVPIDDIRYLARHANALGIAEHPNEQLNKGLFRGHPASRQYGGVSEIVVYYDE